MNSLTREGKIIVFGGLTLIIVITGGIYWWQRGDALLVQPPSDLPDELAETFQTELISRGIERRGHPIEGFDAFLLMDAFRGLLKEDFDGVKSMEGVYSYKNGELIFRRTKGQLISAAEKTVSREGYKILLENLYERLRIPLKDKRSIPLIVDSLGGVGRAALYENCAKAEVPNIELDITLNPENKIAVVRWRDGEKQQNIRLELPYEPEIGFEGCSESAKRVLRHLQEAQIR